MPGCFGQEDYEAERDPDADMFPLPEHDAEHAHQECGNSSDHGSESVRAEFVGPGNKVYRNYHTGLNGKSFAQLLSRLICFATAQRCDALGQNLPEDAPPPLTTPKLPDNWTPYRNRLEFELADFLFTHAEMPAKRIDTLLDIWAASLLPLGGEPLFANHTDLYRVIDSTSVGEVKWQSFTYEYTSDGQDDNSAPWKSDSYDIWYRDPREVIHNLLARSDLTSEMDFVPYREYDAANNQRRWQDFMSGDWAWREAVFIYVIVL